MAWYDRLLNVVRPERLSRELDAEMATHLAERTDDLMAKGMTAAEAAVEARRRFGNRAQQKEGAHEADGFIWLEALFADVRYAVRGLRVSPGFAVVAILSLALGIGANTAIFSLINTLVLRELPVSHPEQLVLVKINNDHIMTNPLWEQMRAQRSVFSDALAYSVTTFDLAKGGEVQQAPGTWVSGSYFQALGIRPIAGRLLMPADDVRGCGPTAVVSGGFAARHFGNAEGAVGKVVSLDGHPFPVIGVTPAGFSGVEVGEQSDIYVPLCSQVITSGEPGILDERSRWYITVMARPLTGMPLPELSRRLALLSPGIAEATLPSGWDGDHKRNYLKNSFDIEPAPGGRSDTRETYRRALMILMAVSSAVLLIACANIANLQLARGTARQREMAIRRAIGAGRLRLIRQLLTESLLLSAAGAVLGALFARWASQLLVRFLANGRTVVSLDLGIDLRVLGFTVAIATATGLLFGLLPAWRSTRVDAQLAMKGGGRGVVGVDARQRVGRMLVAGQVALSLALIASAALLVTSFRKLTAVDLGFRREGVVLVSANFANAGFQGPELVQQPLELLRRLRELPGVESAALSMTTPISHRGWNDVVVAPGFSPPTLRDSLSWFNQVSDGYFTTMHSRLLAGRDIAASDIGRDVVVITETFARKVFGASNPIGRTFTTPAHPNGKPNPQFEVVGVVEDAKYNNVDEVIQPTAFHPIGGGGLSSSSLSFELRTARNVGVLMGDVARTAASISPAITLSATTLSDQVAVSLNRPRLLAMLSGFFGGLALLLAMIGLYGTMAYDVARRRNEIGIRVALGAAKSRVLGMVVGDATRTLAIGIAAGGVLTYASTRVLASFLYHMTATDPAVLACSAVALGLTGLAAASIPAWRASRVDPMTALRED